MFQPARLNSAMVASCKLPLGIPRRSLSATCCLLIEFDGARETAYSAFVANQAVTFNLDAEEQSVVVAIGGGGDDSQPIAAGLAFHPQLLAGAAPEGDKAGFECFRVTGGIEKTQHQHLAG